MDKFMNGSCTVTGCVITALLILFVCLCLSVFALAALAFGAAIFPDMSDVDININPVGARTPTATVFVSRPTLENTPVPPSTDTLQTLENAIVPENDPVDLAERLEGKQNIPETLDPPEEFLKVGAQEAFWVTNTDTAENFQVNATLQYVTDHAYFWIQNGIQFNENDLEDLAETFEGDIYPTVRAFFGSEWSPGIDGDPHLYILYARNVGGTVAGYFSSVDEVHPMANEFSNAHEMFVLSADNTDLGAQYTYSVLAHEFQHMIHWFRDRNEETWMNEGFSELASFLAGYDNGGFDWVYSRDPDIQLTFWPGGDADTTPYYGGSFLFLDYFLDRFGDEATQTLVAHHENGMTSIDLVLEEIGAQDPLRDRVPTADDLFQDWTIASYLQDPDVGDGRYDYLNYPNAPSPSETESYETCSPTTETRGVRQYGVDYIHFTCQGSYTLRFEGATQVGVLPEDPHSGDYAFWSNRGDESDMTLTHEFDFTDHTGELSLSYWTWYDVEEDYDYVYLEASTDGETWQILTTPSGTDEDPSGNSYGWAYNGQSGGDGSWIQETVDISEYAGEVVQLRFEYITDAAVNGDGFMVDDIAIPEIGYSEDFEDGSGEWQAEGFVRIDNLLPQNFRLSLIEIGDTTTVSYLPLDANNTLEIPLNIGQDGSEEVILVVSGSTRFTNQRAGYRFAILP